MKKINYDKEVKILNLRLGSGKSVDSDVKGNVVVDYDKNGEIVNIEIMKVNLDEFKKIGNFTSRILHQTAVIV